MSLHKETVRQLEEIYQKYLPYMNDFTKEEFPELYGMYKTVKIIWMKIMIIRNVVINAVFKAG